MYNIYIMNVIIMKVTIISFFICSLFGCVSKYVVVQKLKINIYHLENAKTKEFRLIKSDKDLKEGDTLKLWNLPEIELNNYSK